MQLQTHKIMQLAKLVGRSNLPFLQQTKAQVDSDIVNFISYNFVLVFFVCGGKKLTGNFACTPVILLFSDHIEGSKASVMLITIA